MKIFFLYNVWQLFFLTLTFFKNRFNWSRKPLEMLYLIFRKNRSFKKENWKDFIQIWKKSGFDWMIWFILLFKKIVYHLLSAAQIFTATLIDSTKWRIKTASTWLLCSKEIRTLQKYLARQNKSLSTFTRMSGWEPLIYK